MPKTYHPFTSEDMEIVQEVMDKYHPLLKTQKIVFQFVLNSDNSGRAVMPKPRSSDGKITLGTTKCFSAKERAAGCPDFLVTILLNWWENASREQRIALIDHELCHCGVDFDEETGEVKIFSRPHEFEGFCEELRRHGAWTADLQQAAQFLASGQDQGGEDD